MVMPRNDSLMNAGESTTRFRVHINPTLRPVPKSVVIGNRIFFGGEVLEESDWDILMASTNAEGKSLLVRETDTDTIPYADALLYDKIFLSKGLPPLTPPSDIMVVYAKADGKIYTKDEDGVEKILVGFSQVDADALYYTKTQADALFIAKPGTKVDVFNASSSVQSWTKPAGCKYVEVIVQAGGGGGGAGRRGATDTIRVGGGGGGGGGRTVMQLPADTLPANVPVFVGLGGVGGAALASDNSTGGNGVAGNSSRFGGAGISDCFVGAQFGPGGAGGGLAAGGTAGGTGFGLFNAGGGGAASQSGLYGLAGVNQMGGGGGGAGGGITGAGGNTPAGGQSGGFPLSNYIGTTAGVGANTIGNDGISSPAGLYIPGKAGSGGGASITGAAGRGGHGGLYGAGGGGGGASLNPNMSGSGGNGADGIVVVISHF